MVVVVAVAVVCRELKDRIGDRSKTTEGKNGREYGPGKNNMNEDEMNR
jgi:hypothetical protein